MLVGLGLREKGSRVWFAITELNLQSMDWSFWRLERCGGDGNRFQVSR